MAPIRVSIIRHPDPPRTDVFHSISLFFSLYLFWLLLSGFFTPFLMTAGAGCALLVVWFARRMDVVDHEGHPIRLGPKALVYWIWLVKEIAKSGWSVSKIILSPQLPISPTLVRFKPSQTTDVGLVLHANSITLTPGTITIEAEAGEFLVHGLTRDGAEGCIDSDMDRRVLACEGAR
jgi:multicomponent Na+:H+ antiporter subunit E